MSNAANATVRISSIEYNYTHALSLSFLFFEAQRSGYLPSNNRIPWRRNSATGDRGINGEDLSGGYYDGNIRDKPR